MSNQLGKSTKPLSAQPPTARPFSPTTRPFYLSPYMIFNILLIISYPILRQFTPAGERSLRQLDPFGFTWQNSIFYTVIVLLGITYARSGTFNLFLADSTVVAKIGVGSLLFMAKWDYALVWATIALIGWTFIPYPSVLRSKPRKYTSHLPSDAPKLQYPRAPYTPQDPLLGQLDQQYLLSNPPFPLIQVQLQQDVDMILQSMSRQFALANHSASTHTPIPNNHFLYKDTQFLLLYFYASWHITSLLVAQILQKFNLRYATNQLRVGFVNVETKGRKIADRQFREVIGCIQMNRITLKYLSFINYYPYPSHPSQISRKFISIFQTTPNPSPALVQEGIESKIGIKISTYWQGRQDQWETQMGLQGPTQLFRFGGKIFRNKESMTIIEVIIVMDTKTYCLERGHKLSNKL